MDKKLIDTLIENPLQTSLWVVDFAVLLVHKPPLLASLVLMGLLMYLTGYLAIRLNQQHNLLADSEGVMDPIAGLASRCCARIGGLFASSNGGAAPMVSAKPANADQTGDQETVLTGVARYMETHSVTPGNDEPATEGVTGVARYVAKYASDIGSAAPAGEASNTAEAETPAAPVEEPAATEPAQAVQAEAEPAAAPAEAKPAPSEASAAPAAASAAPAEARQPEAKAPSAAGLTGVARYMASRLAEAKNAGASSSRNDA